MRVASVQLLGAVVAFVGSMAGGPLELQCRHGHCVRAPSVRRGSRVAVGAGARGWLEDVYCIPITANTLTCFNACVFLSSLSLETPAVTLLLHQTPLFLGLSPRRGLSPRQCPLAAVSFLFFVC